MSRLIKFRVWDALMQKYVSYCEMTDITKDFYSDQQRCSLSDMIFQQFTGLKDKAGQDIYEGDIVKHPYGRSETGFGVGMIGFDDMYCGFSLQKSNMFYGSGLLRFDDTSEYEVIGNMFENPELLN